LVIDSIANDTYTGPPVVNLEVANVDEPCLNTSGQYAINWAPAVYNGKPLFEYDIADEAGTMAIGNSSAGLWLYFDFSADSTVFNYTGSGVDQIKASLYTNTTGDNVSSGTGCWTNLEQVVSRVLVWADGTSDPDPCPSGSGDTSSPLTFQISASLDDVEEVVVFDGSSSTPFSAGDPYFDSSDLELTDDSYAGQQLIGLRFTNVTIPQGSTIASAYIQFSVDEDDTDATSVTIAIEDTGNSGAYANQPFTVSSRSYVGTTVDWNNIPVWTNAGDSGEDQATPDLSTLLQSVVNRSDWASGNAVSFKIEGSGTRTAESYDGESTLAPKLVVELAESSSGDTSGGTTGGTTGGGTSCSNPVYFDQATCESNGGIWF
jgi:hypothetical protein